MIQMFYWTFLVETVSMRPIIFFSGRESEYELFYETFMNHKLRENVTSSPLGILLFDLLFLKSELMRYPP